MRRLSLVLWLTACVTPKPPPAPIAPAIPVTKTQVTFKGMFGDAQSYSLYDGDQIDRPLLERILIPREFLDIRAEDSPIEPWTRRMLLRRLGTAGIHIIAPPLEAADDPRGPCVRGGCIDPAPTSALRAVSFQSGEDVVPAVVTTGDAPGTYRVRIRPFPDSDSLCPDTLELPVGYVEFGAVLQRLGDSEVIAAIHEVQLLPSLADFASELSLPDPEQSPGAFCSAIANEWKTNPAYSRSKARYDGAAERALATAIDRLLAYVRAADERTGEAP